MLTDAGMAEGAFAEALVAQLELAKERLLAEHARALESALKDHRSTELAKLLDENIELRAENARLQKELLSFTIELRTDMTALAEKMKEMAQLQLSADRRAEADAAVRKAKEAAQERRLAEEERQAREAEERIKQRERAKEASEQRKAEQQRRAEEELRVKAEEAAKEQRRAEEEATKRPVQTESVQRWIVEEHRREVILRSDKAWQEARDFRKIEAAESKAAQTSKETQSREPKPEESQLEVALKIAEKMVPGMSDLQHDGGPLWIVVGGGDQGGLLVRQSRSIRSPGYQTRLVTGTKVEQLEIQGNRLHYRRIRGDGPDFGWVSIEGAGGKQLLEHLPEEPAIPIRLQF